MKVQYSFLVRSTAPITEPFPILLGDDEYIVSTDGDRRINGIAVIYRADDPSLWPTLTETPGSATKFEIVMHSPHLERAQSFARIIEGVLSHFGVQSIAWNDPEERYIPESEEEARSLGVLSMSVERGRASELDREPIPFSVVAAAVLRASELTDFEIPLAFFRKGTNDSYEDRHIEACINFLFMLETLFANGKFRTRSVVSEFLSRSELVQAIKSTQEDRQLVQIAYRWGSVHGERLETRYISTTPEAVVELLVDLRGLLHHHTQRHESRWHPNKNDEFLADALFLQFVCQKVSMGLFADAVFSKETEELYKQCYVRAQLKGRYRE